MAIRHPSTGPKKASRKTISCENCRARKVRCSRESPCQHCTKRGEDCVWKADAHPLVRHTKGHSYVETDATILHKTIDILGSRLNMASEEMDDLIRSFVNPSASSSSSHSESESASDTAGSPLSHSPNAFMLSYSPKQEQKPLTPSSSLPFLPPPAWSSNVSSSSSHHQPSFTMPSPTTARPPSVAYGSSSEAAWPQQPMSVEDQMMSFSYTQSTPNNNLVLPQATTPSAFPPTLNGFFDPLPLGSMQAMGSPTVQAQPSISRESEATFNNWLTTALGSSLGAGYPLLPASALLSAPVLAY